jgi:hypothetical protein
LREWGFNLSVLARKKCSVTGFNFGANRVIISIARASFDRVGPQISGTAVREIPEEQMQVDAVYFSLIGLSVNQPVNNECCL